MSITFLEEKNHHPRDDRVTFDEPTHTYTIDGSSDGVISVTTLIHKHFPHFDPDDVIKKMRNSLKGLSEKYKGMTDDEIKKSWNENGKQASERGTRLHKTIEIFYNEYAKNENVLDFCLESGPAINTKEFQHFLTFHNTIKHRLEPFRTEWSLFRKDLKLAGQLDMLYRLKKNPTKFALYDWKCVQEIKTENRFEKGYNGLRHLDHCNYFHYSIQLNIYKRILETLYDLHIVEMFLVLLHPDNYTYLLVEVKEMKREIDYIFKQRKKEANVVVELSCETVHSDVSSEEVNELSNELHTELKVTNSDSE